MSIWKAEVSFDGVSVSPTPDPTLTTIVPAGAGKNVFEAFSAVMIADDVGNRWSITFGMTAALDAGGHAEAHARYTLVYHRTKPAFDDGPNPFGWKGYTVPAVLDDPQGAAGSGYFRGGKVSLIKNFATNSVTMVTPIGSISRTLDENDGFLVNSAKNDTQLSHFGQGVQMSWARDGVHSPANFDAFIQFYDAKIIKDGALFTDIPMSAAQPGLFVFQNGELIDNTGASSVLFPPYSPYFFINQLATRSQFHSTLSAASYPTNFQAADMYRTIGVQTPIVVGIDMDLDTARGIVWRAGPDPFDRTSMLVQRTFDNAHSWQQFTAFTNPTALNSSPTVDWYNERLYLTWHDGANIRNIRSLTGGQTWEMPTTIPFVGTNPRRLIDRTGGPALYFYFNAGGDLLNVVTYDNGASYLGPFTIALGIGAQQIDAEFVPDGSIVVSAFVSGVWTQYRSRDLGRTWA